MPADIELTCDLARSYFQSKRPRQIVGIQGLPYACPLAKALNHAGAADARVEPAAYRLSRNAALQVSPAWASRFVEWIDSSPHEHITAQRALTVLDQVCTIDP